MAPEMPFDPLGTPYWTPIGRRCLTLGRRTSSEEALPREVRRREEFGRLIGVRLELVTVLPAVGECLVASSLPPQTNGLSLIMD
jgi:hypothetical protein